MQVNQNQSPSFNGFQIHPTGKYFVRVHAREQHLKEIMEVANLAKDSKKYDIILGNGEYFIKHKNGDYFTSAPSEANFDKNGNISFSVKVIKDLFNPKEGQSKIINIKANEKYLYETNNATTPLRKLLAFFKALEDRNGTKEIEKIENLRKEILEKYA